MDIDTQLTRGMSSFDKLLVCVHFAFTANTTTIRWAYYIVNMSIGMCVCVRYHPWYVIYPMAILVKFYC